MPETAMKVAIIPARGGSKRIPRKNIRLFCGKPIIAYSIELALESGLFDQVIVSTDDPEIAEVARKYGASVPFLRPEELSNDYAGTNPVIVHALEYLEQEGYTVDYVCCIYATSPLMQKQYLQQAYQQLCSENKDYAFSVTTFPYPIQRALKINAQGELDMFNPQYRGSRSQDLEEAYHDAGQFYFGTAQAFLNKVLIFSPASTPVILPRHLVQDIDTSEDWQHAELMYQALQNNKHA